MVIRPFTAADYPALGGVASALRPDAPWTAAQLRRADQTRAPHLKTGGFLAERGRALGFVRYTQYADLYHPDRVVLFGGVLPEFRRRGVGQRLLAALEQHLPTRSVSQLQTEVSVANSATLAFLRRAGFAETWRRLPYRLPVGKVDPPL